MIFWLTVSFYSFTAASAVLAVLGQAWAKDYPRRARLTRWGSIACIVLLFGISVIKEQLVGADTLQEKTKNDKQRGELIGTIEAQSKQIGNLVGELKDANDKITDTRARLVEAQVTSTKTAEGIRQYVYQRLYRHTYVLLELISGIVEEASDGWLPRSEGEFFSRRSVTLFCRELNVDGPARVFPAQPWSTWTSNRVQEYRSHLAELIKAHGPQLNTVLLNAMAKVENSSTFAFILQWQALRSSGADSMVRQYPPLLCYGDGAIDMALKDFIGLHELYSEIIKGATIFRLSTMSFPLPKPGPGVGKNRFTPEQLSKWQKEHLIPIQ